MLIDPNLQAPDITTSSPFDAPSLFEIGASEVKPPVKRVSPAARETSRMAMEEAMGYRSESTARATSLSGIARANWMGFASGFENAMFGSTSQALASVGIISDETADAISGYLRNKDRMRKIQAGVPLGFAESAPWGRGLGEWSHYASKGVGNAVGYMLPIMAGMAGGSVAGVGKAGITAIQTSSTFVNMLGEAWEAVKTTADPKKVDRVTALGMAVMTAIGMTAAEVGLGSGRYVRDMFSRPSGAALASQILKQYGPGTLKSVGYSFMAEATPGYFRRFMSSIPGKVISGALEEGSEEWAQALMKDAQSTVASGTNQFRSIEDYFNNEFMGAIWGGAFFGLGKGSQTSSTSGSRMDVVNNIQKHIQQRNAALQSLSQSDKTALSVSSQDLREKLMKGYAATMSDTEIEEVVRTIEGIALGAAEKGNVSVARVFDKLKIKVANRQMSADEVAQYSRMTASEQRAFLQRTGIIDDVDGLTDEGWDNVVREATEGRQKELWSTVGGKAELMNQSFADGAKLDFEQSPGEGMGLESQVLESFDDAGNRIDLRSWAESTDTVKAGTVDAVSRLVYLRNYFVSSFQKAVAQGKSTAPVLIRDAMRVEAEINRRLADIGKQGETEQAAMEQGLQEKIQAAVAEAKQTYPDFTPDQEQALAAEVRATELAKAPSAGRFSQLSAELKSSLENFPISQESKLAVDEAAKAGRVEGEKTQIGTEDKATGVMSEPISKPVSFELNGRPVVEGQMVPGYELDKDTFVVSYISNALIDPGKSWLSPDGQIRFPTRSAMLNMQSYKPVENEDGATPPTREQRKARKVKAKARAELIDRLQEEAEAVYSRLSNPETHEQYVRRIEAETLKQDLAESLRFEEEQAIGEIEREDERRKAARDYRAFVAAEGSRIAEEELAAVWGSEGMGVPTEGAPSPSSQGLMSQEDELSTLLAGPDMAEASTGIPRTTIQPRDFKAERAARRIAKQEAKRAYERSHGLMTLDNGEQVTVFQADKGNGPRQINGQYFTGASGTRLMVFYQTASPLTFVHEFFHHLRMEGLIPKELENELLAGTGMKSWEDTDIDGNTADEISAYYLEKWLMTNTMTLKANVGWRDAARWVQMAMSRHAEQAMQYTAIKDNEALNSFFNRLVSADPDRKLSDAEECGEAAGLSMNNSIALRGKNARDRKASKLDKKTWGMAIKAWEKANPGVDLRAYLESRNLKGYMVANDAQKAGSRQMEDMTHNEMLQSLEAMRENASYDAEVSRSEKKEIEKQDAKVAQQVSLMQNRSAAEVLGAARRSYWSMIMGDRKVSQLEKAHEIMLDSSKLDDDGIIRGDLSEGRPWKIKVKKFFRDAVYGHANAAPRLFENMDMGNENGPYYKNIWQNEMWAAQKKSIARLNDAHEKISKAIQDRGGLSEDFQSKSHKIAGRYYSLNEMMSLYMHWRNGNTEALKQSEYKITPDIAGQITKIVQESADAMKMIDIMQDYYKQIWPLLNNMKLYLTGEEMGRVNHLYLPWQDKNNPKMADDTLQELENYPVKPSQRGVIATKTPKFTEKRSSRSFAGAAVNLDAIGMFLKYVAASEHFLATAEHVQNLTWMLGPDSSLYAHVRQTYGAGYYGKIMNLVDRMKNVSGRTRPPMTGDQFLAGLRMRVTPAALAYNWSTILIQPLALFQGAAFTGLARNIGEYVKLLPRTLTQSFSMNTAFSLTNTPQFKQMIAESPAARARAEGLGTLSPEIADVMLQAQVGSIIPSRKATTGLAKFTRKGLELLKVQDLAVYTAVYTAARNYAIEVKGLSGQAVVDFAEKISMNTQSPTTMMERSLLQTDSEWIKSMMMFTGQTLKQWDVFTNDMLLPMARYMALSGDKAARQRVVGNFGGVLERFVRMGTYTFLIPAMIMSMKNRKKDPREITPKEWLVDIALYPLSTAPIVGQAVQSVMSKYSTSVDTLWERVINKTFVGPARTWLRDDLDWKDKTWNSGKELINITTLISGIPNFPVRFITNILEESLKMGGERFYDSERHRLMVMLGALEKPPRSR